jgi:hypothetical protein
VVFVCECGKRFRAPEGTPHQGHLCPRCGGILRLAGTPKPGTDVHVLTEQKKALRDELRARDRQLRIAQNEIVRLKIENDRLREELQRSAPTAPGFVSISEAPVVVDRSGDWKPQELPSERLDLTTVPLLEELPDLSDAPQLPSDRVPLASPTDE